MRRLSIYQLSLLLSISFIWHIALDTPISYACSGGAPLTVAGLIDTSDYVVKARMVEQDDANQNMIIQVEQYLAGGSGPEYLLLNRTDPLLVDYVNNGRSSGADCLGLAGQLNRFNSFYGFLKRNDDGSYFAVTTLFNTRMYQFNGSHSTVDIFIEGGNQEGESFGENYAVYGTQIEVTESEFVDIIAQESGETSLEPDESYHYPLKSPLMIQTEVADYMLPIDWQEPMRVVKPDYPISGYPVYGFSDAKKCYTESCIRISDDGLNVATLQEDGTISFTYNFANIEGQELLFSSTSDAIAIWNNCNITIYTTGYPRLNQEWYQLEQINIVKMNSEACETHHAKATWTPDGRQMAYSDDDGIWLWDVYTVGSQPDLLISSDSDKNLIPNHFSPLGRYLNFSEDGVRQHIDIISRKISADGYISPDDKLIIMNDPSEGYPICSLITDACPHKWALYLDVRDEETGERIRFYDKPSDIRKTEWIDEHSFMQVACVADKPDLCGVYLLTSTFDGWYSVPLARGFDFAYNSQEKVRAILKDEHTIFIAGVEIDTSQWFDEAVIGIEWMPSLFYYD